jgi:putative ABC transport system permease protein
VRSVEIEGVPNEPGASVTSVTAVSVTPEYFRLLQIPIISGRAFTRDDGRPGRHVVIVNQRFVRAYLHASDGVGTRIRLGDERAADRQREYAAVVGVVPDVSQRELAAAQTEAVVYMPFRANPQAYMYVLMRSAVDPLALSRQMREAVQAIDADLPVFDIKPMAARLASATVMWRAFEVGFFVLALISVVLAAVGLYAVTMAWVTERTRELALRVALGATPTQVSCLVLGMVGRHFVIGVTLGLLAAAALARSLRSVLIQTAATDPLVLASCVGVIVVLGAAACVWPIKRAVTLEPAATLRAE